MEREIPMQFIEEQGGFSVVEQVKKMNIEDEVGKRKMIDEIKTRSKKFAKFEFKQAKEEIRGKDQLIPPELDIAFLDETNGQIFVNSDNIPENSTEEILEHEATEMVHKILLNQEDPDISQKDQWRLAHTEALKNEYILAKKNNHIDGHHKCIIDYLESLKKYSDKEEFQSTIQRQVEERERIYKTLTVD